ncbi:MAG: ectoine hydroxylase-related dioxygenase (phytanoyl-CoA dioxygenase family) [Candidatus Azotimanducaceae bacterium]|jgi:ectoine hydroxylase-related dioxygenase (phytanoyl-CoA dioxygenase family)
MQLQTFGSSTSVEELLACIKKDGALIISDLLSDEDVKQFRDELDPYIDATELGSDDFTGRATTRTGALIARSAKAREMVMNPLVVEAANQFLAPYCKRIQLHLSQIIRLKPGQGKQMIHRDRWAWGQYLENVEPQFNTIWALTDFTEENGATQVVPGSIDWPDDRKANAEEICQAVMPAGSVLLYTGSVFHAGGENTSQQDRIGVNLTYTLGWLRQEENQYLSCPPDIAQGFSAELQDMLGYTMGQYALGYYTAPGSPGEQPECVTPAHAVRSVPSGALGGEALLKEDR